MVQKIIEGRLSFFNRPASLVQSYGREALSRALDDFSRILEEMQGRAYEK